jgi:flagellar basal body-associated protein FliL
MRDLTTYSPEPEPVSEPHFEAEWTLRSAQPVIPLDEVEHQAKRKQWLFLILALICATLVGALSASLFYSKQSNASLADSRSQNPAAQVDNSRADEIKSESVAGQSSDDVDLKDDDQVVTDGTELGDGENSEEAETTVLKNSKTIRSANRVSAKRSESPTTFKVERDEVVVPKPTSVVMPDNDPQTGEERRPRRVKGEAPRDQREVQRDQPRDDLFRIRDIFEGPRRRRF